MLFGTMGGIDAVLMFMAGLVATLYAFRRIGKKPGVDPIYDARFARVRPLLLVSGPALMVVAIALSFPVSPKEPPPQEWQTVTTSDGVCRVEMPGVPTSGQDTLILEGLGKPQTQQLKFVQEDGAVRYTLSRSDTRGVSPALSPEKLLDGIRDNILLVAKKIGEAQLVSERDLSEPGWTGREWVIDIDDKRQQSKWALVNNHLYRAIVATPRDDKHLRDASRFLDSFQVLQKPETSAPPDHDKGS